MSMMDAVRSDLDRAFRAREMFPPIAFDPYAETEPACTCGVCGSPVCEGERIYYDSKTSCLLGCEHCIDFRFA